MFNARAGRLLGILILLFTLSTFAQPASADEALTARNKAVVRDFYTTVLIRRDVDAAPRFLRTDYIQHNPQVPSINCISSSRSRQPPTDWYSPWAPAAWWT